MSTLHPTPPQAGALDDAALVAALRAGDEGAYEAFVRDHGGRVRAVARRYLRNDEDVADAVQETFLSAFKALGTFEGKAQLATWLHRIAINAALMRLRTLQRKGESQIEPEIEELQPRFVGLGAHASSQRAFCERPEEALDRLETRAYVRACIDQLPEHYRVPLLLRDIEGLDNAEVAQALGISVNAAKIRAHRARLALRTLLEPRFAEPPS